MSKENRSYEDWLIGQKELARKAYKRLKDLGLDVRLIEEEGKRSIVHVIVSSNQSLFYAIKGIKSRFTREIWVCKVQDVQKNTGFLIHAEKEDSWLVITNREIEALGIKKPSTFPSGGEYYVVPREHFKGAIGFFRRMKKTIEARKQKRINDFT